MFDLVSSSVSFPKLEEKIIAFWKENDIFVKSLAQREGGASYVFYDGPPFATGLPHYGHLLAGTIKDVIPRYQTMRGKYVSRTFGWDCHGLPVENEMEKELGITSRHEIEEYGIAKFNEACRSIVLRYTREWEELVNRMGRWVDFENGYRTMDVEYMESIWWVFKQLWEKGLIYEGHKILPYCPRCATPLSNFESNQAYEDVQDPSITVRFQAADNPGLYFLAWTTTPWTLPSNMALAVGPDIEYVRVADSDGQAEYILARDCLETYYKGNEPKVIDSCTGADLAGKTYRPLFPYFSELAEQKAFRLITADFVSTETGTGIVHIAPGFGEDDAEAGRRHDLPVVCPIDSECRFTEEVSDYTGRSVKEADRDIIRRLKDEGKMVHQTTCQHNYPHCWRCETALIYRAVSTWFVKVENLKERMIENNRQIHWVPDHLRDGRFGKWLENAHDWAISRNRYWGCPLPLWRNEETGETVCIGSVAELEKLTGQQMKDIHKHYVDNLEIPSQQGEAPLRRVPEVLDCWFESGSMPYAEHHYPFENKAFFENNFPADFIAEGLDQTRGWFYTLVVIATALFDKPPFKNVVVNGLVLTDEGKKMSKRLKNYPDPRRIMDEYGADALRLTMLDSPVVRAEDLRFSENAVRETMRSIILPLWNAYSFLGTYARVDNWTPSGTTAAPPEKPANVLDKWILSRCEGTVEDVCLALDNYELQRAAARFESFIDDLTNWYIRRSRRRFWKSRNDNDKEQAYATLHYILITFTKIAAPFIPFITEVIYQNLRTDEMPESVHLEDFPVPRKIYEDKDLDRRMAVTMCAVSLGRYLRSQANMRTRQPLRCAILVSADRQVGRDLADMKDVIAEELNVKTTEITADEEELVHLSAKPNFPKLGPRLGKRMKAAAAAFAKLDGKTVKTLQTGGSCELELDDGGEPLHITGDDIIVQREEKAGMTVANEGEITIALDTRLDKNLIEEGWAREMINRIQNLRKETKLEVSDRIRIRLDAPPEIAAAIRNFKDYIAAETLAVKVELTSDLDNAHNIELDNHVCRVEIQLQTSS